MVIHVIADRFLTQKLMLKATNIHDMRENIKQFVNYCR